MPSEMTHEKAIATLVESPQVAEAMILLGRKFATQAKDGVFSTKVGTFEEIGLRVSFATGAQTVVEYLSGLVAEAVKMKAEKEVSNG